MSDLLKRRISRRSMIKGAAAGIAAGALAACQPKIVEVTKIVEKEKVVEKEVTRVVEKEVEQKGELIVHYMTQLWNWQKLNMATATDQYNMDNRGKVRVEVDPNPSGWTTKVVQMIKDDELQWDGMLRVRNLGEVRDYIRLGILQPWDDFINASKVPWASNFWDEVLPNIRQSFSQDGHLWALPWDLELFCRVHRKEFWDGLGEGTVPAATLDEFDQQLIDLRDMYPDKVPLGLSHWCSHPDEQMHMQLWTDDPWVHEDSLDSSFFDTRGDAYKQMLLLWKRWYDTGIINDDSWTGGGGGGAGWADLSLKGLLCVSQTGAAWSQARQQKIYGQEQIVPTVNFTLKEGEQPKTFTFANGAVLFKGAKNPQEIADWLLWMVDPTVEKIANHSFHKGYLNYYHMPVYKSVYENIIPKIADWAWMEQMYDMVAASATVPTDAHLNIYEPIATAWHEKFMHDECTLEECCDAIYEEEREQIKLMLEGKK